MTKELNQAAVIQIAHKTKTAEAVFTLLAARERNRGQTDLRRLKGELYNEGFKVVPQDFLTCFRDMHQAGIGQLVEERGKPALFKWHFSLKDVGTIGFGISSVPPIGYIKPQTSVKSTLSGVKPTLVTNKKMPQIVKTRRGAEPRGLVVILGEEKTVKVDMPAGMTHEDIVLLAKTILKEAV